MNRISEIENQLQLLQTQLESCEEQFNQQLFDEYQLLQAELEIHTKDLEDSFTFQTNEEIQSQIQYTNKDLNDPILSKMINSTPSEKLIYPEKDLDNSLSSKMIKSTLFVQQYGQNEEKPSGKSSFSQSWEQNTGQEQFQNKYNDQYDDQESIIPIVNECSQTKPIKDQSIQELQESKLRSELKLQKQFEDLDINKRLGDIDTINQLKSDIVQSTLIQEEIVSQIRIKSQINGKRKNDQMIEDSFNSGDCEQENQSKFGSSYQSIQSQIKYPSNYNQNNQQQLQNEQNLSYNTPTQNNDDYYKNNQNTFYNNLHQNMSIERPQSQTQNVSGNQMNQQNEKIILNRMSSDQVIVINCGKQQLKEKNFIDDYDINSKIAFLRYQLDKKLMINSWLFNNYPDKLLQSKSSLATQFLKNQFQNYGNNFSSAHSGLTSNEQNYLSHFVSTIKDYIQLRGMRITGVDRVLESAGMQKKYYLVAENENEILFFYFYLSKAETDFKILIDYEENFLDQIRVLKQLNPKKMVRLCILPLLTITNISFIELQQIDISNMQKDQTKNSSFINTMLKQFHRDLIFNSNLLHERFINNKGINLTVDQFVNKIIQQQDKVQISFYINLENQEKLLYKKEKQPQQDVIDKNQFKQFYYIHLLLCQEIKANFSMNLPEQIFNRIQKTLSITEYQKFNNQSNYQKNNYQGGYNNNNRNFNNNYQGNYNRQPYYNGQPYKLFQGFNN